MPATSRTPDAEAVVAEAGMPPPGQTWRRVFPGDERQLREMRHWLAEVLPQAPARDDVVSVATELSSNAIKHTASGHGGTFAVEIVWQHQPGAVWLAVADGGAPEGPQEVNDPLGEHGRGLMLVHGLSARTGTAGDEHSRVVWAEIAWEPVQQGSVSAAASGTEEAIIDAARSILARRFAGVLIWYGRSTRQWWALVRQAGKDELVAAPSADDLAVALGKMQDVLTPFRAQRGSPARRGLPPEHRLRRRAAGPAGPLPVAGRPSPFADAVESSGFVAAPVPWDNGSGPIPPAGLDRWAS